MGQKFNLSLLYRLGNRSPERGSGWSKAAQQANVIVAPHPNAASSPCLPGPHMQVLCKQMSSKRAEAGLASSP